MLTPDELIDRCVELGLLDEGTEAKWNGMCLVTEDAWFSQLSPVKFPERIVRMTFVDSQEVGDVFDDTGFLYRLGDPEPDEPSTAV